MAKLVDALDLKSSPLWGWRFEPFWCRLFYSLEVKLLMNYLKIIQAHKPHPEIRVFEENLKVDEFLLDFEIL